MPTATPKVHKDTKTHATNTTDSGEGWKTILYNCNCHSFDAVIGRLMDVLPCSFEVARRYAHIAHSNGQVTVCKGSQQECDRVADGLAKNGLRVTVSS